MSLDKAIQHKKEHRKEYRGAKAIDRTCRNHGSCPYCQSGRLFKSNKRKKEMLQELNDFLLTKE